MTNAEWHGRLDTRVQKLLLALRDGLASSLKGGAVTKDGAAKDEKDTHAIFTPNEEIDFWGYQAAALKGDPQKRAKRLGFLFVWFLFGFCFFFVLFT